MCQIGNNKCGQPPELRRSTELDEHLAGADSDAEDATSTL